MKYDTQLLSLFVILTFIFTSTPNVFAEEGHHAGEAVHELKVKDYVSGMLLHKEEAKASSTVKGIDFYFESDENKNTFENDSAAYFKTASEDFHFYSNQAFEHYFHIQKNLTIDSVEGVGDAAMTIQEALKIALNLEPSFDPEEMKVYLETLQEAQSTAAKLKKSASDIKAVRAAFLPLSDAMIMFSETFNKESQGGTAAFVFHCPMVRNGQGGSWLQGDETLRNPYLGSMMPGCGSLTDKHMPMCIVSKNEPAEPGVTQIYEGQTYHFCCKKCIRMFNANPEKYSGVTGGKKAKSEHGDDHNHK